MNSKIMVFRPNMDEFKDFNKYIMYMESEGAHLAGLAKVIPPQDWKPRTRGYDTEDIMGIKIPTAICQDFFGTKGLYQLSNRRISPMTVAEFRKLSESEQYRMPGHYSNSEVFIERRYWSGIQNTPPIYGSDVPGFISDESLKIWNINNLGSTMDYIKTDYGVTIDGVNTAYLYFGMWKASFAWHTEDMDLYSINYLHYGHPKSWYAVPPSQGFRFERLAKGYFPSETTACPAFLRHKSTMISPYKLKNNNIPFNTITQQQGEIMITFPFSYHSGYNHGFNIAESTNFATPRWVEYGKRAVLCHCRPESVRINMDTFVRRFQPEKYENWLNGKDIGHHPENPGHFYACNPSKKEKRRK